MNAIKNQLANALTITNLLFGLLAIYLANINQFEWAVGAILMGGIADMFDGKVARILNISSKIGKYLDSNSDLITFGLAPGILLYLSVLHEYELLGLLIVAVYVVCTSIRLAKYNSIKYVDYFVGVPTTIAGPILAVSVFLRETAPPFIFVGMILLFSFLMLAHIKVKKVWN